MATNVFSSSTATIAGVPLAEQHSSRVPLAQLIAEGIMFSDSTSDMYSALFNATEIVRSMHCVSVMYWSLWLLISYHLPLCPMLFPVSVWFKLTVPRPVLHVPVYDRAYPTRGYEMVRTSWHAPPSPIANSRGSDIAHAG